MSSVRAFVTSCQCGHLCILSIALVACSTHGNNATAAAAVSGIDGWRRLRQGLSKSQVYPIMRASHITYITFIIGSITRLAPASPLMRPYPNVGRGRWHRAPCLLRLPIPLPLQVLPQLFILPTTISTTTIISVRIIVC